MGSPPLISLTSLVAAESHRVHSATSETCDGRYPHRGSATTVPFHPLVSDRGHPQCACRRTAARPRCADLRLLEARLQIHTAPLEERERGSEGFDAGVFRAPVRKTVARPLRPQPR